MRKYSIRLYSTRNACSLRSLQRNKEDSSMSSCAVFFKEILIFILEAGKTIYSPDVTVVGTIIIIIIIMDYWPIK